MRSSRGRVREWRAEVSRSPQSRLNRQSRNRLACWRPRCLLRYRCAWPLVESYPKSLVLNTKWRVAIDLAPSNRMRLSCDWLFIKHRKIPSRRGWTGHLNSSFSSQTQWGAQFSSLRSRVGSASGAHSFGYPAPSWCVPHALGSVDLVMSSRTYYDYNLAFDEPVVLNWSIAQPVWRTLTVSLNSAPL